MRQPEKINSGISDVLSGLNKVFGDPICRCGRKKPALVVCNAATKFQENTFYRDFCPVCVIKLGIQSRIENIRLLRLEKRSRFLRSLADIIPEKDKNAHLRRLSPKMREKLTTSPAGLLLWGLPGRGKTFTLYCLSRFLVLRGVRVVFVGFDSLLAEIRKTFGAEGVGSEDEILNRCHNAEVLILDDIGAGSDSDFARRILLNIVDYRLSHLKLTYATSNLSPEEIGRIFGARIFSRLCELMEAVKCGGNDRRLTNKTVFENPARGALSNPRQEKGNT